MNIIMWLGRFLPPEELGPFLCIQVMAQTANHFFVAVCGHNNLIGGLPMQLVNMPIKNISVALTLITMVS